MQRMAGPTSASKGLSTNDTRLRQTFCQVSVLAQWLQDLPDADGAVSDETDAVVTGRVDYLEEQLVIHYDHAHTGDNPMALGNVALTRVRQTLRDFEVDSDPTACSSNDAPARVDQR